MDSSQEKEIASGGSLILVALPQKEALQPYRTWSLLALVLTSHVIADLGAVDETKGESVLLTDLDTLGELSGAVTFSNSSG